MIEESTGIRSHPNALEHESKSESPKAIAPDPIPASNSVLRRRSARRWRRYVLGMLCILLPCCIGWASQSHWRRMETPGIDHGRLTLSFDYPDDWSHPEVTTVAPRFVVLDMVPQPPTGLRRWLGANILRQDFRRWQTCHVSVALFLRPTGTDIAQSRAELQSSLTNYCRKMRKRSEIRTLQHALGTELQVSVISAAEADFPAMISRDYFVFSSVLHTAEKRKKEKTEEKTEEKIEKKKKDQEHGSSALSPANSDTTNAQICVFSNGDAAYMAYLQPLVEKLVQSTKVKWTETNAERRER